MRPPPCAHDGQNGARDVVHAEHVQLKLGVGGAAFRKLRRAGDAEAGVVDKDVYPPLAHHHGLYGRAHLRFILYVRRQVIYPLRLYIAARKLIHRAPGTVQRRRRAPAYAAAAACYYRNSVHMGPPLSLFH